MRLGSARMSLTTHAGKVADAEHSIGTGRIANSGLPPMTAPPRMEPCEDCGSPTVTRALRSLPGDRTRRCRPCWNRAKRSQ